MSIESENPAQAATTESKSISENGSSVDGDNKVKVIGIDDVDGIVLAISEGKKVFIVSESMRTAQHYMSEKNLTRFYHSKDIKVITDSYSMRGYIIDYVVLLSLSDDLYKFLQDAKMELEDIINKFHRPFVRPQDWTIKSKVEIQKNTIYNTISKEKLESILKDMFATPSPKGKSITIHVFAHEDENGNIVCPAMEQFNKAMKDYAKSLNLK